MDNTPMPQMQSMPPVQPMQAMPQASVPPAGGGLVVAPKPVPVAPVVKKDNSTLIFIIVIVFLSILMVTFFGLFIWKFIEWSDVREDVDGQINVAVAAARDDQAMKDEEEYLEREKYPYKVFSGPADYGQLSFEYPKTWSVYVASDASKGGDFEAYFNPVQVDEVNDTNVMSLRVIIRSDQDFESVTGQYQNYLSRDDAPLSMRSVTVNGITANRYEGTIPNTEHSGYIIIFKIRDKTAIIQTDSVFFAEDYNKLIETIKFNA